MQDVDALSRVLAVIAVMVSGASFITAVLAYRRGNVHLHLDVSYVAIATPGNLERKYAIQVYNDRPTAVQVVAIGFQTSRNVRSRASANLSGDLPYKVDGHHHGVWMMPAEPIADKVGSEKVKDEKPIRAVVTLGSGRTLYSRWMHVWPVPDMIKHATDLLDTILKGDPEAAEDAKVQFEVSVGEIYGWRNGALTLRDRLIPRYFLRRKVPPQVSEDNA